LKAGLTHVLRWAVLAGAIALAVRILGRQLSGAEWTLVRIDWAWLSLALAVNLAYVVLYAGLWQRLSDALGLGLPLRAAWGIYFCSLAGKYLPLRIAGLGYRLWSYHRAGGWPLSRVAGALYFETVLVIASGGLVAAALSPWSHWRAVGLTAAAWIASAIGVAGLVLAPRLLALLARLCPRQPLFQTMADMAPGMAYLKFIWRYCTAWIVLGSSLMLTVRALGGANTLEGWLHACWSYSVAGLAGMLVVFAPAGLGVRDGVLAIALATRMPPAHAALCAIAARLLVVVAEIICACAGGWLLQHAPRSDTSRA
jgi:uncharacterized membrane protein YbhN (UPF0104 family)